MTIFRRWINASWPPSQKGESPESERKASLLARALQFCKRWLVFALTLLLLAGLGFAPGLASPGPKAEQTREPLSLITATGTHVFEVEVAATQEARAKGLMHRERLAPNHGMLFDFERPITDAAMWMKNTPLSLDMLFLGPRGRVLMIEGQTTPGSMEPIGTRRPIRAVLELLGGTAARARALVGDRVEHPIFEASD